MCHVPGGLDATSIAGSTAFNAYRYNFATDYPSFEVSEKILNEGLANTTLNVMYGFGQWNTTVAANVTEITTVYVFKVRRNLIVPYFLTLFVAILFLILGIISMHQNGVSAMDGGFLQILMTTTGSMTINKAAAGGCLGGRENVPKQLLNLKVRFGELIEKDNSNAGGQTSQVRRAGFGTEEEVIPLNREIIYGNVI
jgi:hypothetical protein